MISRPVIINNYATPYRENLFDAIQAEASAAVIYAAQPEAKRRKIGWHAPRKKKRDIFQLSDPAIVQRGSQRRLIVPFATIFRLVQLGPSTIVCTLSRDMVLVQVVALIFAKISRAKIVFWIGDIGEKTPHQGLTGIIDRLRLLCARRADGFIFYSSRSREWLLAQVPNAFERTCWIGGQVRQPIGSPPTRVRRRLHPVFRLLFVGDEAPRKGLAELIDDLSRQPLISGRQIELLCVGGAMPDRTRISGIRIISLGRLDATGMQRAYERVDAAIIASLKEPWGFVFNEAILTHTPCVVSRHAGSATVAAKFGLAYDVGKPKTLNQALERATTMTRDEFDAIANELSVVKAAGSFHRFIGALREPSAQVFQDY